MKKIVAIIIAITMLCSLLPAAFAAEENASVYDYTEYEYVFSAQAHGATATTTLANSTHTVESTDTSESSGRWGFVALRTGTNYSTYADGKNYLKWSFDLGGNVPSPWNDGSSALMAFEIEVKKAGTYKPSVAFYDSTASPKFEMYLIEKPADGDIYYGDAGKVFTLAMANPNSRIAHLDMYGTETGEVTRELDPVSLREATYFLILIPNGAHKDWVAADKGTVPTYGIMDLNKFTLREVKGATNSLEYNTTLAALNTSRIPVVTTAGVTDIGLYTNGALYNLALADWKKTISVDKNGECEPYATMNLGATDPYSVEYPRETVGYNAFISWNMGSGGISATFKIDGRYNETYMNYHPHVTIRVNIPYEGKYELFAKGPKADAGVITSVHFGKAPAEQVTAWNKTFDSMFGDFAEVGKFDTSKKAEANVYGKIGEVTVKEAGEYFLVFNVMGQSADNLLNTNYLISGSNKYQPFSLSGIKLTPIVDTEAEEKEEAKNEIINEDGGNVEATGNASTAATVNAIAAYIDGTEIDGDVITVGVAEIGKDCTVTAKPVSGYKFLYWAKALDSRRRILSDKAEYTFKPTSGTNNLMAVYVSDSAEPRKKAEFYNGNKQLLESFTESFTVPALPTMAGHNKDAYWELAGTGKKYNGGETIDTIDGEMLFVARYADPDPITVTVVGGEGSGTYNYGDVVTATATTRENSNGYNVFNYWEKGGEIVGFGTTYTFNAYETCTVTAVYKEYQPIAKTLTKIILKNINNGNVMAEYIGLENAVEKGMIFGGETLETATYRVAMTGSGKQFAVENDKGIFVTGYAILSDGSVVYDK